MKSLITITLSVLLSLLASYALIQNFNKTTSATGSLTESVYDRVIRTGVLKCGYFPSPAFVDIDPNTQAMSGLVYDYMNQLGKNLGLTIEWTEEVGRGDYIAALRSDRIDAYCTALSVNAERAKNADFTDPYIFDSFNLYVRKDDDRFDGDRGSANKPDVKIVAREGDIMEKITRKYFPNATIILLSQLSADTDPLLYVDTLKADVVITTPKIAGRYMDINPNKLKQVNTDKPFIIAIEAISTKVGEYKLIRMLNLAGMEMQASGQADAIFDRYDPDKKIFLRLAQPFASNH